MLPARRESLSRALVTLAPLRDRDTAVRVRVGLSDGTVADGLLLSSSSEHLSLRMHGGQARHIPAEIIRSVELAKPRRDREWALAGLGIIGATASLVGMVSLPGVGDYLRTHGQTAFGIVFYAGAGLLVILLAKTGLRDWLTGWETLIDVHDR